jgi:hypothetical protein
MHTVAALGAATVASAQEPFGLDGSFHTNIQPQHSQNVGSILLLPDGNMYISGTFQFPGDLNDRYFGRLHADGSRDLSYPEGYPYGYGGGRITPWQDRYYVSTGEIRRCTMDGALDETFNMENVPYYSPLQDGDYYVYPDGRVLVSGYNFLEDSLLGYSGLYGLIWFTNVGQVDTTKTHRHTNGPIFVLSPQPDSKFLCSGYVSNFEGTSIPGPLFRVDADGALDSSFLQTPQGLGLCFTFQTLADGKVLAGGQFSLDGVGDTLSLVRFLPDGAMDPGFHIPHFEDYDSLGMNLRRPAVTDIFPLSNDSYLITGSFDRIDGQPRGCIAVIDTAGNLMDDYFTGDGCGGYFQQSGSLPPWYYLRGLTGIQAVPDGSYYIYGAYSGYDDGTTNGTNQRMLSHLYGLNVGIYEHAAGQVAPLQIAPNPSVGETLLSLSAPVQKGVLTIHDTSGRLVWQAAWPQGVSSFTLPAGALAPGTYVVQVNGREGPVSSGKLVILP